jgi:hypothetical protein
MQGEAREAKASGDQVIWKKINKLFDIKIEKLLE